MTMATKKDIFEEHLQEWLRAQGNRRKRRDIIDHVCYVAKVHPKSVPRSFRRAERRLVEPGSKRRGAQTIYTPDVTAALKEVWQELGEPCGENLHPLMGEHVTIMRRDRMWEWGDDVTNKLLWMSEGTMKRRVSRFKRSGFVAHGKSTTSPGTIHALIPVRSGPWDAAPVGTMQVDTVWPTAGTRPPETTYSRSIRLMWPHYGADGGLNGTKDRRSRSEVRKPLMRTCRSP